MRLLELCDGQVYLWLWFGLLTMQIQLQEVISGSGRGDYMALIALECFSASAVLSKNGLQVLLAALFRN